MKTEKLWGGRQTSGPDRDMINYTAGWDVRLKFPYDEKLIPYDICTNKAHSRMLEKQGIITKEDVHSNIESFLSDNFEYSRIAKLHTARSRNDQIATDMKLYLRDQVERYIDLIKQLILKLQYRKENLMEAHP